MTLVRLPSVALDDLLEDHLDATAGEVTSGNEEPFSITDGQSLTVVVDLGSPQSIAFNAVDFDDIDQATAAEVVRVLNEALVGATAREDSGAVVIASDTFGAGSSVQVTAQPVSPHLGNPSSFDFDGATHTGTDSSPETLLANRVPEPAERGVSSLDLSFDLVSAGGSSPTFSDLVVSVDGVPVLSGGSPLGGYLESHSASDPSTLSVSLTRPAAWPSDSDILIRVQDSALSFDETYTFRTADHTRPIAVGALARSKRTIRVTFSEPVVQVDPAAAGDALNPAEYVIERVSAPAVSLEVLSVAPVSPTEVDLTTDIEQTFGGEYQLLVGGVLDLAGNPLVSPPDNVLPFAGFSPDFPPGRQWSLRRMLPAMNFSEDSTGDLRKFVACLQEVSNVLLSSIDEWTDILDPDLAPIDFVLTMLADLGFPFPGFDLSEETERKLAGGTLVHLYKLRGTGAGIIDAIRILTGFEATLDIFNGTGWELADDDHPDDGDELSGEEDDGDPAATLGPSSAEIYSFRVLLDRNPTPEELARIVAVVRFMKSAREHLVEVAGPTSEVPIDHLELGFSELGGPGDPGNWELH